jgi:hypothetical protein
MYYFFAAVVYSEDGHWVCCFSRYCLPVLAVPVYPQNGGRLERRQWVRVFCAQRCNNRGELHHIRVMWQTPPEGHGRGWRGRLKNGRVVVWDEDVPLEPEFATRDGRRRWRRQGL